MYCVPAKQIRLLELIMEFHERVKSCIKLGAPLSKISVMGLKEGLSRLKSTVRNENLGEFDTFAAKMRSQLEELERSYRTREVL
jgi:V/A-type H+-transporting ATPase subunit A